MINTLNVTKKFDDYIALDNLSCTIKDGCIYGLVGANGAGKSTFLRLLCGVYKPDKGRILVDGIPVYENPEAKKRLVFIPDEIYFLPQTNLIKMANFYKAIYENFSMNRYHDLVSTFKLDERKNINTFSKGMKRQAATILGLSAMPDYLFFDETFDGFDPIMRNLVKKIIYDDVMERNTTTIITSHSLRELEDTCDQLSLLHKGGIVLESDTHNLKTSLFKVQIALNIMPQREIFKEFEMLNYSQSGSVANFIVKGDRDETVEKLKLFNPILLDILPLGLEEVFIYEVEALGYVFDDVIGRESK